MKRRTLSLMLLAVLSGEAAFTVYPYLQYRSAGYMGVRWESDLPTRSTVGWGLTTDYPNLLTNLDPDTFHSFLMSDLLPDTVYHYKCWSPPDSTNDMVFRTPPPGNNPFRFFAYGDTRTDSASHQGVIDQMLATAPLPSFSLHVGDVTEDGTLAQYRTFFNTGKGLFCRVPMSPTLGNHDIRNMPNWYRFFVLPGNERYYSFRYGNSAFHTVSTDEPFAPGSDQYNWLVSELQADSADSTIRHIFVWLHEPPYTTNEAHSSNLEVRQYLCPLFERYGVRIAFEGHVHAYERSLANGLNHIITGGGGAPLAYNWNDPEPWTVFRLTCYEFTLVDVRGDSVFCRSIKPNGTVFDSFLVAAPPTATSEPARHAVSRDGIIGVYPSPFTGLVKVSVALARPGLVSLSVYDQAGKLVASLYQGTLPAGEHELPWDPADTPEGTYLCVLRTPEGADTIPLVHAR